MTAPRPGSVLRGNWATLLLPIAEDESIDFGRLAAELEALTAARVDGVYSNGTAGEFHNQAEPEFDRIQALLAEHCLRAGIAFVVGACHPDPTLSLDRVRRAAALRPAAIQVILPDWVPVTDDEALAFLELAQAAADGVRLLLYNPPHAKRVLAPAALGALLRQAGIGAAKIGDGDSAWYAEARRHLAGIAVFVPGHHLATGLAEGVAAGSFSNVACLSPAGAQRWTDGMMGASGDGLAKGADPGLDPGLDLERRLRGFLDAHVAPFGRERGYSNAALDKLLAAIGDWAPVGTRLRRPYRWIDPAEAERLRPLARDAVPELFS